MQEYEVSLQGFEHITVEADSEEEAVEKAKDETSLPNISDHYITKLDS